MGHPQRIPVLLPLEKTVAYFITLCVEDRKRVLANAEALTAFEACVARLEGKWFIHSAILMPDHLHLIAYPFERHAAIGNLSAAIKRWMRQTLQAKWLWQPGCFDHLLRSGESADAKWEYIRENPVRHGYVKDWRDWPYRLGVDPDAPRPAPFRLHM
jgi:putative transposase